ncbi:MAG: D-glycero-beta-D-manno-heptose 1,7-bisphosphate 7-phosphatase [Deltaproteobacteria bacterium]
MVKKNRAVFLDRDGTINVEKGYLHRIEDFHFIPGAAQAIKLLNDKGFLVIVVTNQSGIARGYYTAHDVSLLHRHVDVELARSGASVDAYYLCPHHPQGAIRKFAKDCKCRKPLPGMLLDAAEKLSIDLDRSYMIGDKAADLEAGLRAGCRSLLVRTGYGSEEISMLPVGVASYADLLEAVSAIVASEA